MRRPQTLWLDHQGSDILEKVKRARKALISYDLTVASVISIVRIDDDKIVEHWINWNPWGCNNRSCRSMTGMVGEASSVKRKIEGSIRPSGNLMRKKVQRVDSPRCSPILIVPS